MFKKTLYPKTKRLSLIPPKVQISEKLDGGNIGFFKVNDKLLVCLRNTLFFWEDIKENGSIGLYKNLYSWLKENGDDLKNSLIERSGFFGEWLGMGLIKYKDLDKKVYMFCKTRITGEKFAEFETENVNYDLDSIKWIFLNQEIPNYIGIVPIVHELKNIPTKEYLDELYIEYSNKVNRKVEGFIINYKNEIKKYIRYKRGKMTEHVEI